MADVADCHAAARHRTSIGSAHRPHEGPERIALSDEQISETGIRLAQVAGGTLKRHFLAPGSLIPTPITSPASRCACWARSRNCASGSATASRRARSSRSSKAARWPTPRANISRRGSPTSLQQTLFNRQKILAESRTVSENEFLRDPPCGQRCPDQARRRAAETVRARPVGERDRRAAEPAAGEPAQAGTARADLGAHRGAPGRSRLPGRPRGPGERAVRHRRSRRGLGRSRGLARRYRLGARRQRRSRSARSACDGPKRARTSCSSVRCSTRETRNARVIAILPNRGSSLEAGHIHHGGNPDRRRAVESRGAQEGAADNQGQSRPCSCASRRGFEARTVQHRPRGRRRRRDRRRALQPGETIAVANTFTLKAELGKGEAEHEH